MMTSSKLRQPIPGLNIREAALPLPNHRGANSPPVGPAAYLQLLPYYRGANSLPVDPAAYMQPLVQRFNPPPPLINPAVLAQAIIQRYHPALRPASAPPSPFMEALAMRYYNDSQAAAATKNAQAAAATPVAAGNTSNPGYDLDKMGHDAYDEGTARGFPWASAHNGPLDAFRHTVTAAWDTATRPAGSLAPGDKTRMLGQANEILHSADNAQELTMDSFNNSLGIFIGRDALQQYQAGKFGTPGTEAAIDAMKEYIANRSDRAVESGTAINSIDGAAVSGQYASALPGESSTKDGWSGKVARYMQQLFQPTETALSAYIPPFAGRFFAYLPLPYSVLPPFSGLPDNLGQQLRQFEEDSAKHGAPTFDSGDWKSGRGLLDVHIDQTARDISARGGYYNPSGIDEDHGRLPIARMSGPA